ncbi:MAG: hypothetical protein ABS68_13010 [Niastella sp. SCN 39-18]|nr:MAG: hypothetical protein ABS68_13010 [Niastella sp. SCN 39-18]OJW08193.1 MAG: hypothetical protein BGO53_04920 [Sphingobacteriales bacterium 39-19]
MTSRLFPGYSPEYTGMQKCEPYNEGWVWEGGYSAALRIVLLFLCRKGSKGIYMFNSNKTA